MQVIARVNAIHALPIRRQDQRPRYAIHAGVVRHAVTALDWTVRVAGAGGSGEGSTGSILEGNWRRDGYLVDGIARMGGGVGARRSLAGRDQHVGGPVRGAKCGACEVEPRDGGADNPDPAIGSAKAASERQHAGHLRDDGRGIAESDDLPGGLPQRHSRPTYGAQG